MKKINKSKERGITLIALIITIIIMLILVSVTINMAVNGGLFGYAKNAALETNLAIESEKSLADVEDGLDDYGLMDYYLGPLEPTLYGDVNCDGEVTGRDSTELASYIHGQYILSRQGRANADVNKDGKIDMTDSELIAQAAVGNITLPVTGV